MCSDPEVRSRVLSTIGTLLDKNADVTTDEECRLEYEERLCEVPLRMMTDFNQQAGGSSEMHHSPFVLFIFHVVCTKDIFTNNFKRLQ